MTFKEFSSKWIIKSGLLDKDSDYEGNIGKAVLELCDTFANQGHSGMSAIVTIHAFNQLQNEYDNPNSPIWKEYWESEEGKKLKDSFFSSNSESGAITAELGGNPGEN